MAGARSVNRRRVVRRPRRGRTGPSRLSIAVGVFLIAVFGAAALKVAQPYLQAKNQSTINDELRRKIEQTRQGNVDLKRTKEELKTPAGTEAKAREEGWRRPEETPVLMAGEDPKAPAAEKDQPTKDR
jgi:cytoskeletal protein RodZ